MNAYDSRHVTLDPGLTRLALRALQRQDAHDPFLDAWRRRRQALPTAGFSGSVWKILRRPLVTTEGR